MIRHTRRALGLRPGVEQQEEGPPLLRMLRDNGLSLAFWALFAGSMLGTVLAGFAFQHEHRGATTPAASAWAYALKPDVARNVLVNWQAAVLQLLVLILLARILRQRGAAHSRQLGRDRETAEENAREHQRSWLYRHSLSLAFAAMFVVTLGGFIAADRSVYNDERAAAGEPAMALGAYFHSARLWFNLFQTWEAEFFAMGAFLLLSIVLREEDSAESKPIGASNAQTGGVNE